MLHYRIVFDDYKQHLVRVSFTFVAQPEQVLWLPTWIPGSYLIREFAKHVESVRAHTVDGKSIPINKFEKNKWQLGLTETQEITVSYQVYAYDLSVRGAYVDQNLLYVNPSCVCLGVLEDDQQACQVELVLPESLAHFTLSTGLKHICDTKGHYRLYADNYLQLIDSPFECAVQDRFTFDAEGIEHTFTISGKHQANLQRLKTDLTKICTTEIQMFGHAPFNDYVFMTMATANHYGGLEHPNSTSLIAPRTDLPVTDEKDEPSVAYQRFLGLCSHEYFHSWLVKCIRPEVLVPYNLHQETYTSLLWVFEGFTSYYDDLILRRSGVISQESYLTLLKAQIDRYLQNAGRQVQSVAESSFDTWIKFYRPDENTNNAGTSYYNKGALVALCIDLSLRLEGSSLDDVMRQLYRNAQQGQQVHEQTILHCCETLTGNDWKQRLETWVNSTQDLPLAELLAQCGVNVELEQQQSLPLGMKVQEKPEGLLVQQVRRDSVAAQAGVSAHDVVIAIDHLKATEKLLAQYSEQQKTVTLHVFRRDELLTLQVHSADLKIDTVKLTIQNAEKAKAWLSECV
ncbi:M61 family metallopeptidase [Acinetobacter sp. B5B]|uniref:M61 family metallopeptidase n=1 Tax=Acinetobacter baretiae TaxID=2605383 RepID=UPI0018C212B2|nr:PDZ domain-containing protein [Acinetobacter baretiae]MBF7682918.1 M61 family metallopeptidase [Acinetobacter baretiae]